MHQDLIIYHQKAQIDVYDAETLNTATSTLSWLNTQLDAITTDKELLTKPLNTSLKAIRDKYRPIETTIEEAISTLKQSITQYATNESKRHQEEEQKILADKRTTIDTKITKLANITPSTTDSKVITDNGSITFTTIKRYKVTNADEVPRDFLMVDDIKVKEVMKQTPQPNITGIEWYEEKSIRNYR